MPELLLIFRNAVKGHRSLLQDAQILRQKVLAENIITTMPKAQEPGIYSNGRWDYVDRGRQRPDVVNEHYDEIIGAFKKAIALENESRIVNA